MRIVVQRSRAASVSVDGNVVGRIEHGLVLLVGFKVGDTEDDLKYLADKVAHLRIFEDEENRMNLDVLQVNGEVLSISQFTLYGDVRKGRRPNYMDAARPEDALVQYDTFNHMLRSYGLHVATGQFGAMMNVSILNEGPVTILLDSERNF